MAYIAGAPDGSETYYAAFLDDKYAKYRGSREWCLDDKVIWAQILIAYLCGDRIVLNDGFLIHNAILSEDLQKTNEGSFGNEHKGLLARLIREDCVIVARRYDSLAELARRQAAHDRSLAPGAADATLKLIPALERLDKLIAKKHASPSPKATEIWTGFEQDILRRANDSDFQLPNHCPFERDVFLRLTDAFLNEQRNAQGFLGRSEWEVALQKLSGARGGPFEKHANDLMHFGVDVYSEVYAGLSDRTFSGIRMLGPAHSYGRSIVETLTLDHDGGDIDFAVADLDHLRSSAVLEDLSLDSPAADARYDFQEALRNVRLGNERSLAPLEHAAIQLDRRLRETWITVGRLAPAGRLGRAFIKHFVDASDTVSTLTGLLAFVVGDEKRKIGSVIGKLGIDNPQQRAIQTRNAFSTLPSIK